eukprot:CAMPEP_0198250216 /NCGR_PEP_ID=MMETSP1447-20131203/1493_1 /TAXON_ID=420782 /ORGANISM="Chaetoceros dichaeta, Strain CCMP1751" /LENGTH=143 /DNA_ID=CAMNT_0043935019 /DNA_START=59 /DNA_END=490 /DNA_ORIENTATION=+
MKLAAFAILAIGITCIDAFSISRPKVDFGKAAKASAVAIAIATTVGVSSALAGGESAGQQIFSTNCAACHADGQNVIMPEKTLEKDALEQYLAGGRNEAAVITLVKNGKNAMPAFGGRLGDDDIQNVATFIIKASENGWDNIE